ncbi:MAG: hypothetical protein H6980_05265 [Gammaproteobacteria bacterium]|nr:hypothetical protein [Gammaproteobacteria bacterium]
MNKLITAALVAGVFAGGMFAPDSWRNAVQGQIDRVTGNSSATASTKTPAAKAEEDAAPPIPYAQVQRPLSLAKGEKLGLGLGLFTSTQGGEGLAMEVARLGYSVRFIAVQDNSGAVWQLLIAGEYDDEVAVERDRSILNDTLQGAANPEIVLIPPPPAKK